jgi:hypothetical protein
MNVSRRKLKILKEKSPLLFLNNWVKFKKSGFHWFIRNDYLLGIKIDLKLLLNLANIEVTGFPMTDKEAHIKCKSLSDSGYCLLCLSKTSSVNKYKERW